MLDLELSGFRMKLGRALVHRRLIAVSPGCAFRVSFTRTLFGFRLALQRVLLTLAGSVGTLAFSALLLSRIRFHAGTLA